ncbi:uncharacterized protein M6B38_197670 [Iris pallida]|uniref:Uncharacterized protein n=1 Tax=Iris pallida TaxID=29817 RepID=A0AAX6EBQ8_IRIPA|nr:uncharacterized protein M6B38_197670 [Iris pallida]
MEGGAAPEIRCVSFNLGVDAGIGSAWCRELGGCGGLARWCYPRRCGGGKCWCWRHSARRPGITERGSGSESGCCTICCIGFQLFCCVWMWTRIWTLGVGPD